MDKIQNIYDNQEFFSQYKTMRDGKVNANELIEIPTIKEMLPDLKSKAILDLGCGEGEMCRYFIQNGAASVLGVDISNNMLALAKEQTQDERVEYLNIPMENISQIDRKFDLVFSSLAFHYVEDFAKLMKDISNLLKDGGMLLFSQEHPLTTAHKFHGEMKKYIEVDGERYFLFKGYNECGKRLITWNVDGVVKYHRNFSCLVNSIVAAGLKICEVKESLASEEAVKLVPKYIYQKDRPYFIFFKAEK